LLSAAKIEEARDEAEEEIEDAEATAAVPPAEVAEAKAAATRDVTVVPVAEAPTAPHPPKASAKPWMRSVASVQLLRTQASNPST